MEGEVGHAAELRRGEGRGGDEHSAVGADLVIAGVVQQPDLSQRHSASARARRRRGSEERALLGDVHVEEADPEVPPQRSEEGAAQDRGQEDAPVVVAIGLGGRAEAGRRGEAAEPDAFSPVGHARVIAGVHVHGRLQRDSEEALGAHAAVEGPRTAGGVRGADGREPVSLGVSGNGLVKEDGGPEGQADVARVGDERDAREVPAVEQDRRFDHGLVGGHGLLVGGLLPGVVPREDAEQEQCGHA